jgi:DNA-directed RNA polymerase subunit N (RpoN/RPB10)
MIANKIKAIRKRINKKDNNINDLDKIGVARAIGG